MKKTFCWLRVLSYSIAIGFALTLILMLVLALLLNTSDRVPTDNVSITSTTTSQNITTSTTQNYEVNVAPTTLNYINLNEVDLVNKILVSEGVDDPALLDRLAFALDDYSKDISIACYSTDGSKALFYNTDQTFFSACTIKMPVMYAYCKQIESGVIDKNSVLTYQSKHYYKGSGDIRYNKFGSTYTVEQLITKSLSISDNVAYVMLLDAYGKKPLEELSYNLNTPSVKFSAGSKWDKELNAKDLLIVWQDIYKYFESGTETAQMLKAACTNTPYNYGTLELTDYAYSHKSGDNFGEFCAYNDAGIVWSDTPYIYVVLTRSEGTAYDRATVSTVMSIVNEIMTKEP